MTQNEFIAAYEALRGRIEALKQRYIESLPFKVGDRVRIRRWGYPAIDEAWITGIALNVGWDGDVTYDITVAKPRKDGRPSRQERELRRVRPREVILISPEV